MIAGLGLYWIAGETYLRLTTPFTENASPSYFVPKVGYIWRPNTEIRHTNSVDFWTISRANGLGFLSPEPGAMNRTDGNCHITMIGDSLVEAREVPIADKFYVRLEELAAQELPNLDISTSAFGVSRTCQINQLPFYDEYARHMLPDLLTLVFVENDFNASCCKMSGYASLKRCEDGSLKLQLPVADHRMSKSTMKSSFLNLQQNLEEIGRMSYFLHFLHTKILWRARVLSQMYRKGEISDPRRISDCTRFGLEQFKERASRDGVSLAILSTHTMGGQGTPLFDQMKNMAEALDIPIIDQRDYIVRQGKRVEEAIWPHDQHWNPTGHRWAAEALLEYLKEHPHICDGERERRTEMKRGQPLSMD